MLSTQINVLVIALTLLDLRGRFTHFFRVPAPKFSSNLLYVIYTYCFENNILMIAVDGG